MYRRKGNRRKGTWYLFLPGTFFSLLSRREGGDKVKRSSWFAVFFVVPSLVGVGPVPCSALIQNTGQARQEGGQPAVGATAAAENPLSISLPGKDWEVQVHATGFTLDSDQAAPGGKRRVLESDLSRGLALSVMLEQVDHQPDLDECRQYQRDRIKAFTGKFALQDVKYWDDGRMAFVQYFIPEYQGRPVKQRNLFACFSREDVFIDVHLSKTLFEPKDEVLLSGIMATIYVADRKDSGGAAPSETSMQLFREGTELYNRRKLEEAIVPYQKALDIEKKDRKLQQNFWRVLVDNLGMAYGITGDLKRARETFDYGVSQDKTYPMFYYNLACTYAEMNDMDTAMADLKTAFQYKDNVIKGESMPDPRTDDSFQRFMSNKKFRELVDSLTAPTQ
jgi:tetratricopeptide (TPR) repeat protein